MARNSLLRTHLLKGCLKPNFNSNRSISTVSRPFSLQLKPHPLEDDHSTFRFADLSIRLGTPEQLKPKPDISRVVFGKCFTDHMFEVQWDESGWTRPKIRPFHDLNVHPAAKVFHYALEVYEGMKAYRGVDGKVRLFRPDLNMKRFVRGAERAMLPTFDGEEFLDCIKKLVKVEESWIPNSESSSLYIRPTIIATEPSIRIASTSQALLYVILSPVGPYFETGFKPVSLLADPQYIRAWPGGCGDTKLGSNYAPTVFVQKSAESRGLQQVLWLYGDDRQLTEAGTMNIFLLIRNSKGEKELITPPLHGLVLPGITRQSVLEMAREWNEFKVTERPVTMFEFIQLSREHRLLEFFGTGTACIICPVSGVSYMGVHHHIPTVEQADPVHLRLLKSLSDIYYGRVSHKWGLEI